MTAKSSLIIYLSYFHLKESALGPHFRNNSACRPYFCNVIFLFKKNSVIDLIFAMFLYFFRGKKTVFAMPFSEKVCACTLFSQCPSYLCPLNDISAWVSDAVSSGEHVPRTNHRAATAAKSTRARLVQNGKVIKKCHKIFDVFTILTYLGLLFIWF